MKPTPPDRLAARARKYLREVTLDKKQERDLLILSRRAELMAPGKPEGTRRYLRSFSLYLSVLVQASREARPGAVIDIIRLIDEVIAHAPLTPPREATREDPDAQQVVHLATSAPGRESAGTRRALPGREPGAPGSSPSS